MKPLYIGIRGLAGSGKDTVGNFLAFVLDNYDLTFEDILEKYNLIKRNEVKENISTSMLIAFADQLKLICSDIFGISIEPFYSGRKNKAWVSLDDFKYTENEPSPQLIVNALDYFSGKRVQGAYMSIREVMVYVGTYVLQQEINKNIFVNLVEKNIQKRIASTLQPQLKYAIITDVRFEHEFDYIKSNGGIIINVVNNRVTQLTDIAENSLDDEYDYDYIIQNNSTYEELYEYIYNLVHTDAVFKNEIINISTRSFDANNFLRVYGDGKYRLCLDGSMQEVCREDGVITMIDPIGGPTIYVGEEISGTNIIPTRICMDDKLRWWIYA